MYAGSLLGVFFMSLMGAILGRKTLILINLATMMAGILLTILCVNLWMAGFGILLCVFGGKNNFNLCVIFMTETTSKKYRQEFSVMIHTFYCLGGLLNVLWYYTIGDYKIVLICCYALPSLFALTAVIFFVKDTPISLISNHTAEEAFKSLQFMARVNKKSDFDLTVEEVREIQAEYKGSLRRAEDGSERKFSMLDLFRYKSLRNMTIVLVIMDCTLDLEYYTPTLMLDQFKLNIFLNGLIIQSSLVLACLLTTVLVHRFSRRMFNMLSYAVITLCAGVLIFIWDQNKEYVTSVSENLAVLVVVFVNQFVVIGEFNVFLVYVNELFPTPVRIVGIGFMKIFGGLSQTLAAPLISVCLEGHFKIMIIFAALAVFSARCAYGLPETFGKMPAEVIQELSEENKEERPEVK
jgi:MFS transporter, OCT family, solute carrier family 22 (organic cation transporter), member 4/5